MMISLKVKEDGIALGCESIFRLFFQIIYSYGIDSVNFVMNSWIRGMNLLQCDVMERVLKVLLIVCSYVLSWILLTLILTAQQTYGGASWAPSLLVSMKHMIPWALVSPCIIIFSYWFPILYGRWWLNSALHVALCIVILIAVGRIRKVIIKQWPGMITQETIFRKPIPIKSKGADEKLADSEADVIRVEVIQEVSQTAPLGVPLYVTIVFLFSLSRYRGEINRRDKVALKLESQLTQTQLDLLRSQLQPHFLFNTLNSISSLIYSDPDKADNMVIKLSSLLRRTLDQRDVTLIPLEQEIETIDAYLQIQSMRFSERMKIKFKLEKDTLTMLVPPMILLPLVENAVRYGVEKSSDVTTIRISSSSYQDRLTLEVYDDGPGIDATAESGTGVGLANIQSRLETVYPMGASDLTLIDQQGGGVVASIDLPITMQPES